MVLESMKHENSCFVTLTYAPEKIPKDGSVKIPHYQKWLRDMRKIKGKGSIRFFLVGEYGDQSMRPHYHAALFGIPSCTRGRTNHRLHVNKRCCENCNFIQSHWPHGSIDLGELTQESASYIAGYVTKKLTRKVNDHQKNILGDRAPEFARMSLKPGIGALSIENIADALTTEYGCESVVATGDVPISVAQGKKSLPLGSYLRKKLRTHLGFKKTGGQDETLLAYSLQMCELFTEALKKPENKNKPLAQIIVEENKQKLLNMVARNEIYKGRKSL